MANDTLQKLKEQFSIGMSALSANAHWYKQPDMEAYINAYSTLAIKLNYSLKEEPATLLKSFPVDVEKPNIVHFLNGMSQLGFLAKAYRGSKNFKRLKFPCVIIKGVEFCQKNSPLILFYENNKLISYDPYFDVYDVFDPNTITRQFSIYSFESFDDNQYDLSRGILKFLNRSWCASLISRFKGVVAKLVLVSIFLHLFSLALPLYIIYTYSKVIVSQDTQNFLIITASIVFLLLCEQILRHNRVKVLAWLASRVDYIVTHEVLEKLNRLPLAIVENLSLPSQLARLRSFASIRDFFNGPIFSMLLELPGILLMIALVTYLHYLFSLIFLAGFISIVFCLYIFHKIISRQVRKSTLLNTEKYYVTSVFLDKLSTLHYQGLENYYLHKLEHLSEQATQLNLHTEFSSNFVDSYGKFVTSFGILLTMCTGIYLIWQGEIGVATLLATVFLSWRIFSPIQVAASTLARSEKLLRTIKQIDEFMALPDEKEHLTTSSKKIELKGQIRLANVGVFYSSNKHFVLRNFSCNISPGKITLLTGESGCGKSTVLKLINGYIKPNIGKVLLDQYDIQQLNLQSLREQVFFTQENKHVIPGTIYNNIQLVNPFISKKEIQDLCVQLLIMEAFDKLPNGLDTVINAENMHGFSRSFLKYIDLLRIFFSPAKIKLIDGLGKESFSHESWEIIVDYLKQWRDKFTLIIASEDEDLLAIADDIIQLERVK